ncbi:GNAT family N-acetyltransferase [Aliikangiella marina]|uniref:GNAT family N-acetyltransferase n=1 Tax=Aliikangiella marina TaxID=1712262 RepID=A0A545T187_9GAMM|nr:GNAT family N-acetyltransferase [Aliikangiella marina]TQV70986.1 GNAT family N-acetyltransferase [Aliikangiella marina]
MASRFHLTKVNFSDLTESLIAEWEALLPQSTRPSIYASFDYIDLSVQHYVDEETKSVFILFLRDLSSQKLVAVFPMSRGERPCYKKNVRMIEHAVTTHNSDVDKPYPIIHRDYEKIAWESFRDFFKREYTDWDWIEYAEVIPESRLNHALKTLFSLPYFYTKQNSGPVSPIVDLTQNKDQYWAAHRNMRKKYRRMQRVLGDNYSYQVFTQPDDMEQCLQEYIQTERLSWKVNQGLSEETGEAFYRGLISRLAPKGQACFGILYDGNTPVSVELSFIYLDTVYFAHGTYNNEYKKLSPGSVSTSKFIEYFLEKNYRRGDFLAGFAHYINAWSSEIYPTKDTVVFKINPLFFYYVFMWSKEKLRLLIKRNWNKIVNNASQNS